MANPNRYVQNWADQQREWLRDSRGSTRVKYLCDVCNVDCQGQKGLDSHQQSKKCKKRHRAKERQERGRNPSTSSSSTSSTSIVLTQFVVAEDGSQPPPSKKSKRIITPIEEYHKQMGLCSKHRDLSQAMALFREKETAGVHATLKICNNLMFLCFQETTIELRIAASKEILNYMKERNIKYDETASSNAVRLTSMAGNIKQAMELVEQMRADDWTPKKRTYTPIFQFHPTKNFNDLYDLNVIYLESEKDKVECTEEEFRFMLKACVAVKQLEQEGNMTVPEFNNSLSPTSFFNQTCERMKQFVYSIDDSTLKILQNWCHLSSTNSTIVTSSLSSSNVSSSSSSTTSTTSTTSTSSTSTNSTNSTNSDTSFPSLPLSIRKTFIQQDTCECQQCNYVLPSIDLTPEQNDTVLRQIITSLASDTSKFEPFKHWLQRVYPNGAEVVIDGANVGYFGRRPPKEKLNFQQIDRVIRAFTDCEAKEDRKTVLLILHQRHFKNLSHRNKRLVDGWKQARFLYQTPHRMNDDWFWLWCAVWSSRFVKQPFVITNDQMRDHHFQMLSARYFLKWRERHVVRFGFERLNDLKCPPTLWFPLPYSTQIHVNLLGAPKIEVLGGGIGSEKSEKRSFHFPSKTREEKEGEAEVYQWYCLSSGVAPKVDQGQHPRGTTSLDGVRYG